MYEYKRMNNDPITKESAEFYIGCAVYKTIIYYSDTIVFALF